MNQTLFLVAGDQPDLYHHLTEEFLGEDIRIVIDRRGGERRTQGERRRRAGGGDRRAGDRRQRRGVERDLRAIGFTIIQTEGPGNGAGRATGNPVAVREVRAYLVDRFRYYTAVATWDFAGTGQGFVLVSSQGRPVHRVVFEREFLDYYGSTMPGRIPSLLDEWKLVHQLELAGPTPVLVSSYGIHIG